MRLLVVASTLLLAACEPSAQAGPDALQFGVPLSEKLQDSYQRTCARCHSGIAPGLPRAGDPDDWEPLLAKGADVLVQHAIEGYRGMPAMGYCGWCSKADIRALVAYMAGIELPPTKPND